MISEDLVSDKTYVSTPDLHGRASTGRVLGFLDHLGNFEATDRSYGLGEPKGTIDGDNVIFGAGVSQMQMGYLTNTGEVYMGSEYLSSLVATVTGTQLLNTQGEVVLIADGPQPARSLAAAWLLLRGEDDRGSPSFLKAIGAAAATYAVDTVSASPVAPDSVAPVPGLPNPVAPRRPQCRERDELGSMLDRQNRFAIGDAPQEYLPRHARNKFSFQWKVGTLVNVTKPLSWQGAGRIIAVSSDWDYGLGTKLYPRMLVEYWDGSQEWCSGTSLRKLDKAEYEVAVARDPRRSRPRPKFDNSAEPDPYPEPESIIGLSCTSPLAAYAAASIAGGKAVMINASTDQGLAAGLTELPRGGKGDRVIPVVVGAVGGAGFKSAMSGILSAINDGVDVCRVLLLHPDQNILRDELGVNVLDFPLDELNPPKVEHLSPRGWVFRTKDWVRLAAPDLAALPAELRSDAHVAAQALCAALPLITSDYERPTAFGVGGDRKLFDAVAPLLTRYTLVAYVSDEGANPTEAAPDPDA